MKVIHAGIVSMSVLIAGICGVCSAASETFPAKISLSCTKTNSTGFVKTKITNKEIIDACATKTSIPASHLAVLFTGNEIVVADIVETNVACPCLTFSGNFITNVNIQVESGSLSQGFGFYPLTATSAGAIPADFTATTTFSLSFDESKPAIKLSGTVQGGSVSNQAIYTGKISVGGKPFGN